jgi:hypothetical protein
MSTSIKRLLSVLSPIILVACGSDEPTGPATVRSVEITAPTRTLEYAQSIQLSVNVTSANNRPLTDRSVRWTSSNETIATVSNAGVVTAGAVRGGSAVQVIIGAEVEGKSSSVWIYVSPIPVATIAPSVAQVSLFVGQTEQLGVVLRDVTGETVTGRSVTWFSSTPHVATVDGHGLLSANAPGRAEITATTDEGLQAFVMIESVADPVRSIRILNSVDSMTISDYKDFDVEVAHASGRKVLNPDLLTISSPNDRFTVSGRRAYAARSGHGLLSFTIGDITDTIGVAIGSIQDATVNQFLATPAPGSELIVPVVIINYLPTEDGIHINQNTYPIRDYANRIVHDLKLAEVINWNISNDIRTKFSIEEGSKFRGFQNPDALPYVGIRVVKVFNVYEIDKIVNPASIDGEEGFFPDYTKLFSHIGLERMVNQEGVKEVWFNSKSLKIPESNMSSPVTGDVSNSDKSPDLPIYQRTYVVYGNFIHRWYAENLHNRGHQIEAQLAYINSTFFWQDFVGYPKGPPQPYFKGGRCGSTHYTPNSRYDYDYANEEFVDSDCGDWRPDHLGRRTPVNVSTWRISRRIPVPLPAFSQVQSWADVASNPVVGADHQGGWLIYWMQSIPGKGAEIPYNDAFISNWWDIIYNWDDAIRSGMKLWRPAGR